MNNNIINNNNDIIHNNNNNITGVSASIIIQRAHLYDWRSPFCEDVDKYEKVAKIGQGTFGEVFKARHRTTSKTVALKKILMENESEGFPLTAIREIKILQHLKHENVVRLLEICCSNYRGSANNVFYLVFEFCDHDLSGLLCNKGVTLDFGEIKGILQQILNGLYYIHVKKILHRDMKTANILITNAGIIKLADFGLSRTVSLKETPNKYTNRVVTLWYRAPELLLGDKCYTSAIDIWGVGCIMGELFYRTPIFQGVTEQQMLQLISKLCGSINPEIWNGVQHLKLYNTLILPKGHVPKVRELLKHYTDDKTTADILEKFLTLNPNNRIDADSALNHDFFWTDPMPTNLSKMMQQHALQQQGLFQYLTPNRVVVKRNNIPARPQPVHTRIFETDVSFYDRIF